MTRLTLGLALASVFAASWAVAQSDPRHSGYHDMGADLRRMQDDDTANPAMLFVQAGQALWQEKAGTAGKACADCHHDADQSMKGVAARYPAIPPGADKPVDLEGRINLCRTSQQRAPAFGPESPKLLGLAAYVALQSRGQPIAPPDDPRLAPFRSQGAETYKTRQGQLNLSCANCHEDRHTSISFAAHGAKNDANGRNVATTNHVPGLKSMLSLATLRPYRRPPSCGCCKS